MNEMSSMNENERETNCWRLDLCDRIYPPADMLMLSEWAKGVHEFLDDCEQLMKVPKPPGSTT